MDNYYFKIPALRKIDSYGTSQYAQELRQLLPRANDWDAEAQYRVGQILSEGPGGVPVDLYEAAKWIDLAQRKSQHDAARMQQAMIDIHGWEVVGEGKRRGFRWQQELYNAEAGWPAEAPEETMACVDAQSPKGANYGFGCFLNDGKELPFDYEKSFRFFLRGAEQDDCVNCTYNVGHAYYCGKGVRADPHQAVNWLKRALNMGDGKAALWLGVMAQRGHGLPRDRAGALYFCRQAQRLGHPDADRLIDAIDRGAEFL